MKKYNILILITLIILTTVGCSGVQKSTGVIKIGWMGSLTGDQAPWGICEFNTVKMLVEETNAAGGWLGQKLEVIGYDTKGVPEEAIKAVKQLTAIDKVVAIIGPNTSSQAIAIYAELENAKVLSIATVATSPKVTSYENGKTKPYNFRICFIDPYQGAVAASYAYNVLSFKSAAILFDASDEYALGLSAFFEKTFTQLGGTLAIKQAYSSGDVDFKIQLKKIQAADPDVFFMPLFSKDVILIAKQAREIGINATFIGGDAWVSDQLLEEASASVEGSYIVNHLDFDDPKVQAFKQAYNDKYQTPIELNGFMAYDAFKLLEVAVTNAKSADSEAIKNALETSTVQGITGKIVMNKITHNPEGKDAAIIKIENGAYKFQEKFSAQ